MTECHAILTSYADYVGDPASHVATPGGSNIDDSRRVPAATSQCGGSIGENADLGDGNGNGMGRDVRNPTWLIAFFLYFTYIPYKYRIHIKKKQKSREIKTVII